LSSRQPLHPEAAVLRGPGGTTELAEVRPPVAIDRQSANTISGIFAANGQLELGDSSADRGVGLNVQARPTRRLRLASASPRANKFAGLVGCGGSFIKHGVQQLRERCLIAVVAKFADQPHVPGVQRLKQASIDLPARGAGVRVAGHL
jgi:hypothetical protein